MQAGHRDPEFTLVARAGQRRPAHVVVQVEVVINDPGLRGMV